MRRRMLAAALLAVAPVLAACSEEVDASPNRDEPVRQQDRYVALGDSYTSGPGLGPEDGPAGCARTTGNYPHLLAEHLDLELVDVSCGGARTEHLTEPQVVPGGEVPPQLDALSRATDLVTLSIGGNDSDLYGELVFSCLGARSARAEGAPCLDAASLEEKAGAVQESLVEAVGEVLERAPRARVVVVGYPQIVPASGTCPQLPLGAADYPLARRASHRLTQELRQAAREAGAEYVDVWALTAGHDICGRDPWIAGARPERPGAPFHPYAAHQDAVADALVALVRG